jgi:hypothetical protein
MAGECTPEDRPTNRHMAGATRGRADAIVRGMSDIAIFGPWDIAALIAIAAAAVLWPVAVSYWVVRRAGWKVGLACLGVAGLLLIGALDLPLLNRHPSPLPMIAAWVALPVVVAAAALALARRLRRRGV